MLTTFDKILSDFFDLITGTDNIYRIIKRVTME